jgi:3'-phosphoadenosine 5'-phosphosulfate sulfotransferase (PAPS reductase)/FAD synthetase
MSKVRHLLGISGGKDSAALAIYLFNKYPKLDIEYYTCDTGEELDETYRLIQNLDNYFGGNKIMNLRAKENSSKSPFDHLLTMYGGFLPSSNSRWCTKKLKLEPFENFVSSDQVISYVGIRGDEDRDGYISRKTNIQSIFPFRRNIWSEDVVRKFLNNSIIDQSISSCALVDLSNKRNRFIELLSKPLSPSFTMQNKLNLLFDLGIKETNHLIFEFLKSTEYPLAKETDFPLLDNEEILVRDDIFRILEESGVGVPEYYKKIEFEVNGKKGDYSRSRSGCYFCFFQQKIEWVWLYEQHPDRFAQAQEYEKDGYTWNQEESLTQLIQPDRIIKIKEDYIKRTQRNSKQKSPYLLDILGEAEGEGCASCFI